SQNAQLRDKGPGGVKKISYRPIWFLANTHIHGDHTAGNPFFAKMGVTIFAREELRDDMLHPPPLANGNPAPARDPVGLPVVTHGLDNPVKIHINAEALDAIGTRAGH